MRLTSFFGLSSFIRSSLFLSLSLFLGSPSFYGSSLFLRLSSFLRARKLVKFHLKSFGAMFDVVHHPSETDRDLDIMTTAMVN